jgi:ATP-dependent phosphofructokinase / diphosphate-dependent phosphofructokinase
MMGGLAGGADLVIIPEFEITLPEVFEHLRRRRREGRGFSVVVVAEGVRLEGLDLNGEAGTDAFGHVQLSKRGVGDALSRRIEAETGFETRVTVLGHLQRGGSPSALDRIWALRLGTRAVDLLHEGHSGVAPVRRDDDVAVVPLGDLVAETRRVPRDLYELARVFS